MKFIIFLSLNFILVSNLAIAETIFTKAEILKKSSECFKNSQNPMCKKLILQMEQMQLVEFKKNRFKCQASILGLQTELVEAYFFKKIHKRPKGIMIPYVIKNC